MTITEVCLFHLIDGVTLADLKAPESLHMKSVGVVSSQPGFEKIAWGLALEDPKSLFWFIEWDNIGSHKAFMDSEIYPSFVSEALSIADVSHPNGPIELAHYPFSPLLSTLLAKQSVNPKVEYFQITIKETEHVSDVERCLQQLATDLSTHEGGVDAVAAISVEDEKNCLALMLWPSVEVHQAYRETDGFKSIVPKMRPMFASATVMHVEIVV
ncbi:hypothetical protein H072_5300 [Dactylellina haptotyla CBS 200.50]|uniref:ABM domain-containing protein n=1 Tax=Dactylellina haptotyla (strain CBS 200.50) TaxID=1284197 RepID=S8AI22_DACHA|nr:hypothetical protein H072_5300 [Dactylellina haptotyla CBS 200.50]